MYLCVHADIFEKSAGNKMFSRTSLKVIHNKLQFSLHLYRSKEIRND